MKFIQAADFLFLHKKISLIQKGVISLRKILTPLIFFLIICATPKVSAYEIFWYDKNCGFDKFAKIVLYPLSNAWENPNDYLLGGEGTRNFKFNSYLDDRLTKKLKKINFIRLANEIQEKSAIIENLYSELLQPFDSEQARAAAVENATMADMYIVPQFKENRVQEDISPRREFTVQLKSWTEEIGGPKKYEIYDEKKYTVQHVIPEKKIYLHIMQVEFTGYNNRAEKILTSLQQDRRYNIDAETQFKYLVDDFQESFVEAREEKNSTSGKFRIGFTPVDVEGTFGGDIFFANAMTHALQTSALKKIKKARVVPNENSALPVDFYLRSVVTRCDLIPVWNEPTYFISNNLIRSEKKKWRDKDGNEQEMTLNYYEQSISNRYAYWSFYWIVDAHFWFVDPQNSVIISKSYSSSDDKPVDAYRHAAEDFCKEVNSNFEK